QAATAMGERRHDLCDGLSRRRCAMIPQALPVIAAKDITRPNPEIVKALLASAGRAQRHDDNVLVLKVNQRFPKFIHPLSPGLEIDCRWQRIDAPSRPSERMTRTGSASAAGSRSRRGFFLAPRAAFASPTI